MPESVGTTPDPTQAVRDLVDAAIVRLDGLRNSEGDRFRDGLQAIRREMELRAENAKEIGEIRAEHDRLLREAESKRLDANRAVDTAAVGTANERAVAQATVLATQVTTSAEALRIAFAATTSQLAESISALQRTSYEGAGRSTVNDPAMLKMVTAMEMMQQRLDSSSGRGSGVQAAWGWIVGAIAAFGSLAALFMLR